MAITDGNPGLAGSGRPGEASGSRQRFVLWPHRSLSRRGTMIVLALVTIGAAVPPLLHVQDAAALMIGVPCLSMPAALALALWVNNRAARVQETVTIADGLVRIARTGPHTPEHVVEFNPYWLRVELQSDRQVVNRIVLAEGRRRVSIGEYLTPEDRAALAEALRGSLRQARAGPSVSQP